MFAPGVTEQTDLVLWIRMSHSHCACYNSPELLKALLIFISPATSNRKVFKFFELRLLRFAKTSVIVESRRLLQHI